MIDAGYEVDIYEASPKRLGGKIQSGTVGGETVNLGAEFVDKKHTALIKVAHDLGLQLDKAVDQQAAVFQKPDGSMISEKELLAAFRPVSQKIERDKMEIARNPNGKRAKELDGMSASQYLESLNKEVEKENPLSFGDRIKNIFRRNKITNKVPDDIIKTVAGVYASEAGNDPGKISALQFATELNKNLSPETGSFLESDAGLRIHGGTATLIDALQKYAEAKGAKIHLGAKTTSVHKNGSKFHLGFNGAQGADVDQVIMATPAYAFKDISGLDSLGLSKEELKELQGEQFTHSSKFFVKMKPGAAEKLGKDCFLSCEGYQAWQSSDGIMTFLAGGESAI